MKETALCLCCQSVFSQAGFFSFYFHDQCVLTRSSPLLQCRWVRGPKDRGDGEDAEGGSAGESQAGGEQSEFSFIGVKSLPVYKF